MKTNKLRVIQDFEKVSQDIQEQIKLVYPEGFSEYLVEFKNKNKRTNKKNKKTKNTLSLSLSLSLFFFFFN